MKSPRVPVLASALLCACSSLTDRDARARAFLFAGSFTQAADAVDPELTPETEGTDRLLFLMDRGLILHAAGRYHDSNRYLLAAAGLSEDLDYIQISEEAGKFITNERTGVYRGEDFERVLIHTYLAMNFAAMGRIESALVECRRINDELEQIAEARGAEARLNAFAVYLSAVLYEAADNSNDAYVDFRRAYDLMPDFPPLPEDLLRHSHRLGLLDQHAGWKERFGRPDWRPPEGPPAGEIVVMFEAGLAPRKVPDPRFDILPKFAPTPCWTDSASIHAGDRTAETRAMENVEQTLIAHLDSRIAGLAAKRLAALAAKEAAVYGLKRAMDKKDKGLGQALFLLGTWLVLESERPDLRSWQTLPKTLQIGRLSLPPGTYDVRVQPRDAGGNPTGPEARFAGVAVEGGKKVFLNARSVR